MPKTENIKNVIDKARNEKKILTVKELKSFLEEKPDDAPVVIYTDGYFNFPNSVEECFVSTWNMGALWVVPKDEVGDVKEYPLKESIDNGEMVPAIFIKREKE